MVGPQESQGQPAGSLQFNQPRKNQAPGLMRAAECGVAIGRPA
jgi:hypothetical protein